MQRQRRAHERKAANDREDRSKKMFMLKKWDIFREERDHMLKVQRQMERQ